MDKKFLLLCLCSLLLSTNSFAQLTKIEEELVASPLRNNSNWNYMADFNLRGLGSTRDKLPFWLYKNQRGRVSEDSHVSAWITGKAVRFLTPESFFILGAGVLYHDGRNERTVADELYLHFQNSWMYATLGRKQRPELYNGLSASNENILWSLNARPLPGIRIGTTSPVFLFSEEGFGFEGSWEEYLMGNDRDTKGAKLHHKNFRLVYRSGSWQIKAGLQHFVQWGGTSPEFGKQPEEFEDYLRIFFGQEGGATASEEDQQNALGNHIGGYEFYISKEFENLRIEAFYNHLFEDGSGRRLGNTPDGRYGVFFESIEKNRLINSVMYELYYTEHQSHTTTGVHKNDYYFNNSFYRSGWTYENRVLGVPFFTVNPEGIGIINNKFTAHHLGIGGQLSNAFRTYPYKLLLSYARNGGTYPRRWQPKQDVFYGLLDVRLLQTAIDVNVQLGLEFNSYTAPFYGAGVSLTYKL